MTATDVLGAGGYLQNGLLLAHYEWLQRLINEKLIIPQDEFLTHPDFSYDDIKAFLLDSKVPPCQQGVPNPWRLLTLPLAGAQY